MTTHPCPVCGSELTVLPMYWNATTRAVIVHCSCCPEMNGGVFGTDVDRAVFALNLIAESMDPDQREEICMEAERFSYAARRRTISEDDPRLEDR